MSIWGAVIAASLISFLTKLSGYTVPSAWLEHPKVARVSALLPVALLASLVVLQTFSNGQRLTIDARAAGLLVAVAALIARLPFIVVVILAAVAAALLRGLAGWS